MSNNPKQQALTQPKLSLSLSHNRKRKLALRKTLLLTTLILTLTAILAPPLVSSVQNIFIGFNKVTSIWYNGQPIEKVVYQGQIIWERTPPPPAGSIQAITSANCPTNITIAQDIRDGHHYAVQKLPDGNCWMLTNLAYGGAEAGTQLTSGRGQSTNNGIVASDTNWNLVTPPYNSQKQWTDPTNANVVQYNGTRCTTAFRTTAGSINYTECGYLYNWCSALGVGNTGGPAAAACAIGVQGQNIANAGVGLCPTGWRLPTGGASGELKAMYDAIGATYANLVGTSSIWRGVLSGSFNPSTGLNNQTLYGHYWLATALSSTFGHDLTYEPAGAAPQNANNKYYGFAVRCIAG